MITWHTTNHGTDVRYIWHIGAIGTQGWELTQETRQTGHYVRYGPFVSVGEASAHANKLASLESVAIASN